MFVTWLIGLFGYWASLFSGCAGSGTVGSQKFGSSIIQNKSPSCQSKFEFSITACLPESKKSRQDRCHMFASLVAGDDDNLVTPQSFYRLLAASIWLLGSLILEPAKPNRAPEAISLLQYILYQAYRYSFIRGRVHITLA